MPAPRTPVDTRLGRLAGEHPGVVDALLALALLPLAIPHASGRRDEPLTLLLVVGLAAPLAFRRRRPAAAFAVCAAVAFMQWTADIQLYADAALLLAVFSVAARGGAARIAAAVIVMEIGAVLATVRWGLDHPLQSFVAYSALSIAACLVGIGVRHRRALVDSLEERAERLERERDREGRLAAAAERARIARELHDIVAHNVSVMVALADGAAFAAARSPEQSRRAMEGVSATGRQALAEMRGLLGVLRDEAATGLHPQPGLAQLDVLVEQVRAAGLDTVVEVGGDARPLPAGLELSIYRIVQEALTNTLKHGGPGASARVRLQYEREAVEIEVSDTGNGGAAAAGGRGLAGMRERSAVHGGVVEAGPRPDGGWQVRTRLRALADGAAAG